MALASSHVARGRRLRAVMVAGMASMMTALIAMTLLASNISRGRVSLLEVAQPQLWLGEHWYIKGLEDDGKFMVPESPKSESSGNALFDFGNAAGTPVDPDTRLPAGGTTQFFTPGDGEKPGLFDIEAIRANEDGQVPAFKRAEYYDDSYPTYTEKYGETLMPKVDIKEGHVTDIQENVPTFAVNEPIMGAKYDQTGLKNYFFPF